MKHILGLDLGTNSIGWAVVNALKNSENKEILDSIESAGSRIIPMDAAQLGDFDKGNTISQTADRTAYRGTRRLRERFLLRRERLNRVLDLLGFFPRHYSGSLNRYGKLMDENCKIAWNKEESGKSRFIFNSSFNEMLSEFQNNNPSLVDGDKKVPYDWTIYYLRKKALTQKISKEELAWILLNFNQKRGYYQLRGEEEDTANKPSKTRQYFDKQKVVNIVDTNQSYKSLKVLIVELQDGTKGKIFKKEIPDWIGRVKDIIVSIDIDKDGKDKYDEDGMLSCRFKIPTEAEWDSEWALVKLKTENDIITSHITVGTYIYDTLLKSPTQKIRGKLVRTIERKYYKDELEQILTAQIMFHDELQDESLYKQCIEELYSNNEHHRNNISKRGFLYLFLDDIIFYQRPLKSKKSLIANCPYEEYTYIDRETGEVKHQELKCIAKSHPLYQEFRIWQFISNLRIYQKERIIHLDDNSRKTETDVDITGTLLPTDEAYVALYEWLSMKKEIKQDVLLKYPAFGFNAKQIPNYRWNYVEDKSYPCNETRSLMLFHLNKAGISVDTLTEEMEESLWHILYSVEDKNEIVLALKTFATKYKLDNAFVNEFSKFPPFKKEYGSYSAKAVKRLLALMRIGKYWNIDNIDKATRTHIQNIIDGECDEYISKRIKNNSFDLSNIECFKGLPVWLACYVAYKRHSESKDIFKWSKPEDIDLYLKSFKQHSLHNPIVEQVIMETLRTVRDIWKQVGNIDEIHVELGREMKNSAEKRAAISKRAFENENTNLRIKALLTEFVNPDFHIENVRPYSPSQQDLFHIYEEGVLNSVNKLPDDIQEILNKFNQIEVKKRPTHSEILRYKLWLEQKYRSPYTGNVIPLGKLFTPAYEIEHIIPQSRYFDDSISNKVICESEVNKLKDRLLGYEFIKNNHGRIVKLSLGKEAKIFTIDEYEEFVKEYYSSNRIKMKKLLMEDIPDEFIERQLNDSRYISKIIKSLLSNIVREEDEIEAISKNVIPCTGGITDRLKKDWGINNIWNDIIIPRFSRLNALTNSDKYTSVNTKGDVIPTVPLEMQKGFRMKRIDHRHHAMDAIVIACANRNIVNYLNNQSATQSSKLSRCDLQKILCDKFKTDANGNYRWIVNKPWNTFTQDTFTVLSNIIVSFKQNTRIINKTTNRYLHYDNGEKKVIPQTKGDSWAVRKPMHKETVFGEVNLRKIKEVSLNDALNNPESIVDKRMKKKIMDLLNIGYDAKKIKKYFEEDKEESFNSKSKVMVYYFSKDTNERYFAFRKNIDTSFDRKRIENSITDTGIQKIMIKHLEENENDPNIAFSADGLESMNNNIVRLNNGVKHPPINKIRYYEKADKFSVGETGSKRSKFVEAAKGTNLFFAIYENEVIDKSTGKILIKRSYASIPLNVVIERQKLGLSSAPEDKDGNAPKYVISPNDLVYVPTKDEQVNGKVDSPLNRDRIYKMVSCTGNVVDFIPFYIASPILQTIELGSNNKAQRAWSDEMIKEICIPIKIDRIGNVIRLG